MRRLATPTGRLATKFRVIQPAVPVRCEEVESIDAADHYVELRTAAGAHLVREPLSSIEQRLDPARFVRIHRSTIVNVARVAELRPLAHGECHVRLASGRVLRCSRTYAVDVRRVLGS